MAQSPFDESDVEYKILMQDGDYKKAAEVVEKKISEINSTKTSNKRIPSSFVSFATIEQEIDINSLFNKRTVDNFLLEENEQLYQLNLDASKIYHKLKDYKRAVAHLYQSLRYKKIEYKKDDLLFAQLALIYQDFNKIEAYRNSLEIAYRLNPAEPEYSKNLGLSFYTTSKKKKAIYYLINYVNLKSSEIDDKTIYIKIANVNADINRFLEAEKYYSLYLEKGGNDLRIVYVLGEIAFKETGNFDLAINCYGKYIQEAPKNKSLEISKSMEHLADINFKRLKYTVALEWYLKSVELEKEYLNNLEDKQIQMAKLKKSIDSLKEELLKKNNYIKYNEYQFEKQEYARLELEKIKLNYEMKKHTTGKRRWKIAATYEKLDQLEKSIQYYRECVRYYYKANKSRDKIEKLQLKINRGY